MIILSVATAANLDAQHIRHVPDSVSENMKKQREFLYANDPSYWQAEKPKDDSFLRKLIDVLGSPAMRIVWYIVLALIILFIIYQVAVVNNFFVLRRPKKKTAAEEVDGEELTRDNIDAKIDEAISAGQYRLAIRYLYLKTLVVLNDKSLIRLHAKSTNNDYLNQMRQSPAFSEFASLTRIYEYVWYGEFVPGRQQFEKIHNNFHQFISRR
jgi:hypothetical protein